MFWEPKHEKTHAPAVPSVAEDGPLDFGTLMQTVEVEWWEPYSSG